MKAADLTGRETQDLVELREQLKRDLFSYKMKNFTNQLDDTSLIQKTRRDVARIEGILAGRAKPSESNASKDGASADRSES